MFTGIVEELGRVRTLEGARLTVGCRTVVEGSPTGASVAVNGVCLTVIGGGDSSLSFDVSEETFGRTALSRLAPGDPVNLERSVTLLARLGGHLVQGHVDGVGRIAEIREAGDGREVAVAAPEGTMRYIVEKGSVALDGVSLTVARVERSGFAVALIPHTLAVTTLGTVSTGDPVNLEVDVIAKYVERLLEPHAREERQ